MKLLQLFTLVLTAVPATAAVNDLIIDQRLNSGGITGRIVSSVTPGDFLIINGSSRPESRPLVVADISDASANGRSLISAANYAAMRALPPPPASDPVDEQTEVRNG